MLPWPARLLSRPPRRLLSTKASSPLQPSSKAERVSKTAAVQKEPSDEPRESAEANPWSHFAAFSSMDDYVDVTLIQYNNKKDKEDKKKE
ncbi:unnamed protein product [Phytophthora fragariaefolia]|uniref:Unnamed protein product n=1 Tax=Phytophthora fragariaefolia TaxID=1490495 RepID=A0A9W6XV72_9STRA|nr:unnamed protein product [Phytophthora fragariaefolia]